MVRRRGEVALTAVSPNTILAHAADAVAQAVARRWPGECVHIGPQLPSVTNYVTPVQVGERRFVAKYSVLGVSLISLVRGKCGSWPEVNTRQRDYIRDPCAQLERERRQLRLLNAYSCGGKLSFQVPEVIGYEDGVLITTAVEGPSLAAELINEHAKVDKLLSNAIYAVQALHRNSALARLLPSATGNRPHTSITDTFKRKFLGSGGRTYLNGLGAGWSGFQVRNQLTAGFTSACEALAPLLRNQTERQVIYGDLKPEHIILGSSGRQIWLDPGLQLCDPCADLAKLMSRTALLLIVMGPSGERTAAIVDTFDLLAARLLTGCSSTGYEDRLRRLLLLWVADWVNYLATGLSLPPGVGLPLPPGLLDACAQAEPLLQVIRATAAAVVGEPVRAWEILLSGIHELVAWPCR